MYGERDGCANLLRRPCGLVCSFSRRWDCYSQAASQQNQWRKLASKRGQENLLQPPMRQPPRRSSPMVGTKMLRPIGQLWVNCGHRRHPAGHLGSCHPVQVPQRLMKLSRVAGSSRMSRFPRRHQPVGNLNRWSPRGCHRRCPVFHPGQKLLRQPKTKRGLFPILCGAIRFPPRETLPFPR